MSTPASGEPDDMPQDAWLKQALKHASGHDATPPAALRSAILREAAAKARPGSRAHDSTAASLWARIWKALGRSPVASALASVLVMLVAGVLWWDRPLERVLPEREWPNALAGAASAASTSASRFARGAASEGALVNRPADGLLRLQVAEVEGLQRSLPGAHDSSSSPADPARAAMRARAGAPSAPAPVPSDQAAERARLADAPLGAGDSSSPRMDSPASGGTHFSVGSGIESSQAQGGDARTGRLAMRRGGGDAESTKTLSVELLRLGQTIQAQSGWQWQRDDGETHLTNPELVHWLEQLAMRTLPGRDLTFSELSTPEDVRVYRLRLLRGGRVVHSLSIDAVGVSWQRLDGGTPMMSTVRLARPDREALIEALMQLTP